MPRKWFRPENLLLWDFTEMHPSELFIRRPVGTTLLAVALLLSGVLAYGRLPVSALPQVDYPIITVQTFLPGASAETMAASVTTPLERQLGQVPSLSEMTSSSSAKSSKITLRFDLDRDIDAAEQDVQAAINAASQLLPKTLPTPPIYTKSNPADAPIISFAVRSREMPITEVDDWVDSILVQRLSQVSGVGLVRLGGSQKPAIRIEVDLGALAARGLTLEDVRLALQAANVNQAKGNLEGHSVAFVLDGDDQLVTPEDFRSIVLAEGGNAPLRLSDVASVTSAAQDTEIGAWADKGVAVLVMVQKQPGANVLETVARIRRLLPLFRESAPKGISLEVLGDRTATISASVFDVEQTLLLTLLLVAAVIYVFLRDARATFIAMIVVPLSMAGTFAVMSALGYSINNLTLMALTISTGFVVDDAIVMLENIARYLERGETSVKAAISGAREIGFTVISLTVSLIAVLIPLFFMEGLVGRLFFEFAATLGTTIALSAVLSLTLTPMLAAVFLRPTARAEDNLRKGFFAKIEHFYEATLARTLLFPRTMLTLAVGTCFLTLALGLVLPKGFFPSQDTGALTVICRGPENVSFPQMGQLIQRAMEAVGKFPEVLHTTGYVGADGVNDGLGEARLQVVLQPHEKRKKAASDLGREIELALSRIGGLEVHVQADQDLVIDTQVAMAPYLLTLQNPNEQALTQGASLIEQQLQTLPEFETVVRSRGRPLSGVELVIDRDQASRMGVNFQQIDDALYDAFGQRIVSTIYTQLNFYRVILDARQTGTLDSTLDSIFLRGAGGDLVPLGAFAHYVATQSTSRVLRQNQFPADIIAFKPSPHVSLGQAVAAVERTLSRLELPADSTFAFAGQAQAFREALFGEGPLILAAMIVVYLVLGVLYESYIHPITILSTLPSAGLGAFAALWLCGMPFDVIALIGLILLIGIVKKNAIMMIDFAIQAERDEEKSPRAAILQACVLRFRPIMMTTCAAFLGGIPLALGQGIGSEMRRPLGVAIAGGLLVSQVLTLYTTPAVYLALHRFERRKIRDAASPS